MSDKKGRQTLELSLSLSSLLFSAERQHMPTLLPLLILVPFFLFGMYREHQAITRACDDDDDDDDDSHNHATGKDDEEQHLHRLHYLHHHHHQPFHAQHSHHKN
jgi:hypothetical protein